MLKPSIKFVDYKYARDLIDLSLKFFVVSLTATIIYGSTPFLISQLFGPSKVAAFNVAYSIFNFPIMLIGIVCAPILPLVTQAYANGDFAWLKSTLRILVYLSLLFSIGTLILIFTSNWIYRIWIGDKIIIPFDLTVAIGVHSIISILNTPFSNFINGMGKVSILTKLALFFVVIFIGFSYILAMVLNNIISVPIALIITSLVGLIVVVYTVLKNLNFKNTNTSNY
jgi:O-antigen/teichoic acid export membrane protein